MIAADASGRPSIARGPARSHDRVGPRALAAVAIGAAVLAVAPIVSLIVIAFGETGDLWSHLVRHVVPTAVIQTVLLLSGVATITVVIGVGTAWAVTTFQFPLRNALTWMLALPLAIPTYIVAYVYVDLLDPFGPVQSALRSTLGYRSAADYWFPSVRSLPGAILLMGIVLYPYVYLAARAIFQTQAAQFVEAARVLGARPLRLVVQISLPLARPAIAVGVALALLEALNDIGLSEYLGVQTLTLSIFTTWLNRGSLAGAAQIACLMLTFVAALIAIERIGRRGRTFISLTQQGARFSPRIVLKGGRGLLAALACLAPVALGFLLPAGYLIAEVTERWLLFGLDLDLLRPALTTVSLATVATVLVLTIGFAAVAATRHVSHPLIGACVNVAGIGYAIPGTVLALGLLTPLVLTDEALNAVVLALGGPALGLMLAGSVAALVIAYVIRFLAIALGLAQAGFSRIAVEFDEVARMLGAGPATLARTIHLPLIRQAIWGAALLVFVDCLKELPATLLLRPLNVETLSTTIYQYATRGSFEEGALAALIIVAVGIPAVLLITRQADARIGKTFAGGR